MNRPPTLNNIVRAALQDGLEMTKLAEEAAASAASGKGKPPEERKGEPLKKEVPAEEGKKKGPSSEVAEKTASALDYILHNARDVDWNKVASEMGSAGGGQTAGPAMGGGATLPIHEANSPGSAPGTNQGQAKAQPPTNPGLDTSGPGSKTLVANDINDPAGSGKSLGNLQEAVSDDASGKEARAHLRILDVLGRAKVAEDAGTAKISAGPAAAFSGEEAGVNVPSVPSDAAKARKMIASNQAAIDATKRDAQHQVNLKPVANLLDENAMTRSGDSTLHQALDNTTAAGAKIASLKTAAIKEYLAKCASIIADPSADPEDRAKAQKVVRRAEAVAQFRGGA